MPTIKDIGAIAAKLAGTPVGKQILTRLGYGTLGYGVGAEAEREMKARGADISPGSSAAMKMNPALMYAALGPSAVRWAKKPFTAPGAHSTISRVWRPASIGAAATINPMISYLTDPGKKKIKDGLNELRDISGTVPNYLKSVSDDASALVNSYAYGGPSAMGETIKRLSAPTVHNVMEEGKKTLIPPLKAGLDPAIRSVGKTLAGGALGTLGAYGLSNWLIPEVKEEDANKRMMMTPEDRETAYQNRKRKEVNRKALVSFLSALGGTAGAAVADPESTKFWWKAVRGK